MSAQLRLDSPWLDMRFAAPRRVLSWALNRPGYVDAPGILWREVRNADLAPDFDVETWLGEEVRARDAADMPCFLTSRDVGKFVETQRVVDGVHAQAVVTLGLSNAERVGRRMVYDGDNWGTINIAVECSLPMSDAALLETISIIAQARTAALLEHGPKIATGQVSGTGTDCIAIAAPQGTERFAGLHTAQGEAIGGAVYEAIATATHTWLAQYGDRFE